MTRIELLASSLEIIIYLYDGKSIVHITGDQFKLRNDFLNSIIDKINGYDNKYHLIKFKYGYFLKIPISTNQILFAFPPMNVNNMRLHSSHLLKNITKLHSTCMLLYNLWTDNDAPNSSMMVDYLNCNKNYPLIKGNEQKRDYQTFFKNEQYLLSALKEIDKKKVKIGIKKLNNCIGNKFMNNKFVRGEKDVLISMISVLGRNAIEAGLPVDDTFSLQDELIERIESQKKFPSFNFYMNGIIWKYFYELKNYRRNSSKDISERCQQYIKDHVNEWITITELSENFGYSKSYLHRVFKKKYGITINRYIKKYKIGLAKKMLIQTNYNIKEISGQLGYMDVNYFYRVFKKVVGMTATEYRISMMKINIKK